MRPAGGLHNTSGYKHMSGSPRENFSVFRQGNFSVEKWLSSCVQGSVHFSSGRGFAQLSGFTFCPGFSVLSQNCAPAVRCLQAHGFPAAAGQLSCPVSAVGVVPSCCGVRGVLTPTWLLQPVWWLYLEGVQLTGIATLQGKGRKPNHCRVLQGRKAEAHTSISANVRFGITKSLFCPNVAQLHSITAFPASPLHSSVSSLNCLCHEFQRRVP